MHYIRLLRPPILEGPSYRLSLKLVLSITTDLGDSFLSPGQPIPIRAIVRSHGPDGDVWTEITSAKSRPTWKTGLRVLKLDLPLPPGLSLTDKLHVRPANQRLVASSASDLAMRDRGLIVPVSVDLIDPGDDAAHVCYRVLRLSDGDRSGLSSLLQVEEEIGDTSLARHVWDGGLMTVAHIANMCTSTPPQGFNGGLPVLKDTLCRDEDINILEVGCGIGTLGIGLAHVFRSVIAPRTNGASILMTDLPEAEERVVANISRYHSSLDQALETAKVAIDFEELDWENGRLGKFGAKVQSNPWDLIVLSDCTYNVDTIPALVQTLSQLHAAANRHADCPKSGWRSKVMLATKPRHWSEEAFLGLMDDESWSIDEKLVLPLPMLDAKMQRSGFRSGKASSASGLPEQEGSLRSGLLSLVFPPVPLRNSFPGELVVPSPQVREPIYIREDDDNFPVKEDTQKQIWDHVKHCMDYLRQTIKCNADTTLEAQAEHEHGQISNTDDMNVWHQCHGMD